MSFTVRDTACPVNVPLGGETFIQATHLEGEGVCAGVMAGLKQQISSALSRTETKLKQSEEGVE